MHNAGEMLAMTGVGALIVGPLVIQVWWVAAFVFLLGLTAVVAGRILRASARPTER